jgi:hypothetical protein
MMMKRTTHGTMTTFQNECRSQTGGDRVDDQPTACKTIVKRESKRMRISPTIATVMMMYETY